MSFSIVGCGGWCRRSRRRTRAVRNLQCRLSSEGTTRTTNPAKSLSKRQNATPARAGFLPSPKLPSTHTSNQTATVCTLRPPLPRASKAQANLLPYAESSLLLVPLQKTPTNTAARTPVAMRSPFARAQLIASLLRLRVLPAGWRCREVTLPAHAAIHLRIVFSRP